MATSNASKISLKIGFGEFVTLAAAVMSTQAIAIDAMLPAFPVIVRQLNVANPNHGQWVITAYMTGLGVGQLVWGLLSDRYGRRPVLLGGLSLYVTAALLCSLSGTFESLLVFRFIHGLAAASVVVVRSVIRDLYSGRNMARVMSLTFIVFLTVPILAPSIGQLILLVAPWRYIFGVLAAFAMCAGAWLYLRLPETLHPEFRLTVTRAHVAHSIKLVLGTRTSLCYTLAMMCMFGSIMAYVGMVQQIFSEVFHRPKLMPSMFAVCAIFMGFAAFLNSRIVEKLGMRLISHTALLGFILVTGVHGLVAALGFEQLWTFIAFQSLTMACFSLAMSNFGAMAMEPVGQVAGIAASLQGFVTTFLGALLGAIIGRQFNGTTVPFVFGCMCCGLAAAVVVLIAEKGKVFRAHQAGGTDAGANAAVQVEGAGWH